VGCWLVVKGRVAAQASEFMGGGNTWVGPLTTVACVVVGETPTRISADFRPPKPVGGRVS
jgi:hypothetical protein